MRRLLNEVSIRVLGRLPNRRGPGTKSVKLTRLKNGYAISTVFFPPEYYESGRYRGELVPVSNFYETAVIDPNGDIEVIARRETRSGALKLHARTIALVKAGGRVTSSWRHTE